MSEEASPRSRAPSYLLQQRLETTGRWQRYAASTPQRTPERLQQVKRGRNNRAGITAVGEQEQQPNVTTKPLDVQGQIPEVDSLFDEATAKAVIKKANPRRAAGPSGLCYSHLQAALCDELVDDFAALSQCLSFSVVFRSRYSEHCTRALAYLRWGQQARSVARGYVLRRVTDTVFFRRYGKKLADYFQP